MSRLPLFLLLVLTSCATPQPPALSPAEQQLAILMEKRLALSREVAWVKYRNGLPVRDPAREAALLERVAAESRARQLDPGLATKFIAAQIEASCALQELEIRRWSRGAPLPALEPRALVPTIRDDIQQVTLAMLDTLAMVSPGPSLDESLSRTLRGAGIPRQVAVTAAAGLRNPSPSHLPIR